MSEPLLWVVHGVYNDGTSLNAETLSALDWRRIALLMDAYGQCVE